MGVKDSWIDKLFPALVPHEMAIPAAGSEKCKLSPWEGWRGYRSRTRLNSPSFADKAMETHQSWLCWR